MSIGVSAHKNEYRSGVRIGNWVEEQFGDEAPVAPKLQIAASPYAPAMPLHGGRAAPPKPDEAADVLFSHGKEFGQSFQATSNGLHYPPPATREYGATSSDRVHRTFFWGSKRRDANCPLTDANAPTTLLDAKRQEWASDQKSTAPVSPDMYRTVNAVANL